MAGSSGSSSPLSDKVISYSPVRLRLLGRELSELGVGSFVGLIEVALPLPLSIARAGALVFSLSEDKAGEGDSEK